MPKPDFASAEIYATQRLTSDLPTHLIYHNAHHTLKDVLPAAMRLAEMEGVSGDDKLLLKTAVLFHDLGFVECYTGHEAVSIRLAQQVLPDMGFDAGHIEVITGIIQATHLPQTPHTLLEQIMADADLDVIGREDFFRINLNLRNEHASMGWLYSDEQWYTSQLKFINQHAYFTGSARRLREAVKHSNILEMTRILENIPMPISDSKNNGPQDLTMSERAAILRAVSLFSETPDEILTEIAELLTPVEINAGEAIIHKGEPGDSMYIIVHGRVLIHDGEMELSRLGPADVFGEMALVDDMPRVATGTAQETTQLLRLDQETFYQLMQHRPEVTRGVIRVLNRHLRGRVRDMAEDFLYIQQVQRITAAAAALEAGLYESAILDEVCKREDELGQLARVFQRMANEVQAREQRLKQEVQALRIQIDEVKKAQQVAEITESEYFQQLQQKIARIRKR